MMDKPSVEKTVPALSKSGPLREVGRAIVNGTKYIFALRAIHRDYYSKK